MIFLFFILSSNIITVGLLFIIYKYIYVLFKEPSRNVQSTFTNKNCYSTSCAPKIVSILKKLNQKRKKIYIENIILGYKYIFS
jgi:hypothetical protein